LKCNNAESSAHKKHGSRTPEKEIERERERERTPQEEHSREKISGVEKRESIRGTQHSEGSRTDAEET
jgi:hypothetical protein